MIYDITSIKSALQTIHAMTGINENDIYEFIKNNVKVDDIISDYSEVMGENLVNQYNKDIASIDLTKIEIVSVHYTSNNDGNYFLLENGIRDLKYVLQSDSPLKNFLSKNNIHFNIINNQMIVDDKQYSIKYSYNAERTKTTSIAHKIYCDNQLSCFMCIGDISNYLGDVHRRPEILFTIDAAFPSKHLSEQWIKNSTGYMIKFKTPLKNYTDYTIDTSQYGRTHRSIIMKMLDLALHVISVYSEHTEIYSYLKEDTIISSKDIINIEVY